MPSAVVVPEDDEDRSSGNHARSMTMSMLQHRHEADALADGTRRAVVARPPVVWQQQRETGSSHRDDTSLNSNHRTSSSSNTINFPNNSLWLDLPRLEREREGRCGDCGLQTHEFVCAGNRATTDDNSRPGIQQTNSIIKVPLTIPHQVLRGRCLLCHPLPPSRGQQGEFVSLLALEQQQQGGSAGSGLRGSSGNLGLEPGRSGLACNYQFPSRLLPTLRPLERRSPQQEVVLLACVASGC